MANQHFLYLAYTDCGSIFASGSGTLSRQSTTAHLNLGLAIDPSARLRYAVDVYSFGIILYELLTFGKAQAFDLSVFNASASTSARLLAESGERPDLVSPT